jgi:hypothetical protein
MFCILLIVFIVDLWNLNKSTVTVTVVGVIRQWLQSSLGVECNVASILKPSADLNSIIGDIDIV